MTLFKSWLIDLALTFLSFWFLWHIIGINKDPYWSKQEIGISILARFWVVPTSANFVNSFQVKSYLQLLFNIPQETGLSFGRLFLFRIYCYLILILGKVSAIWTCPCFWTFPAQKARVEVYNGMAEEGEIAGPLNPCWQVPNANSTFMSVNKDRNPGHLADHLK